MARYTEISKRLSKDGDFRKEIVIECRRYMPSNKRFTVNVKSSFEPTRTVGAWVSAFRARELVQAKLAAHNS